jgi:nucleoside-diphosphate-sugar epimerase
MKKILVTGASGFIGSHCLPLLLDRDYEVHAVYSKISADTPPTVYWHQADLLEQKPIIELIESVQPSHLLHLAWYAIPGKYWTSPENLRWVQASLTLLQEFARRGGQRVVMAGTCAEYDWRYGYCSESVTPLSPSTIYGICKHSLQAIVEAYSVQFGLSSAWGRIFFPYGPNERPSRLVPSVIGALLRGEPAKCSHGEQIRDFLHVQDVASAFVTLLESEVGGAVNIASGKPIAVKSIVLKIAELLDREDLVQLGALPLSANEPPLLVADVTRLSKEVQWHPKFDLAEGLAQTISYWKQQLLLNESL